MPVTIEYVFEAKDQNGLITFFALPLRPPPSYELPALVLTAG
jgi:hypothetical protein